MQTLNQVVKSLNDIADAHLQINHFFFGEEYDFATSGIVHSPVMICSLQPSVLSGESSTLTYDFKVYIGDIPQKGLRDKNDILSDTLQICLDVIAQLQHPDYSGMVNTEVTLNDFADSFDCELYGHWFNLKIKYQAPFDRCAIPQSTINLEGGASYVTVYDSLGNVLSRVSCGGYYTCPASGGVATVENSDASFSTTVNGGDTLVTDDTTVEVYVNTVLNQTASYPSLVAQTINIS